VLRRVVALGQFAEQRQGDDALARAGTAGDDHDLLGVGRAGLLHRVQHDLVGEALLVEQDELVAVPDLGGGDLEQVLRRLDRRRQQLVGGAGAGLGRELRFQIVDELATAAVVEQAGALVLDVIVEVVDVQVIRIVQDGAVPR
jgi:hypothetical protein